MIKKRILGQTQYQNLIYEVKTQTIEISIYKRTPYIVHLSEDR